VGVFAFFAFVAFASLHILEFKAIHARQGD
jgi:hypothetical protein